MTTLVLEVNNQQKKMLKSMFKYLRVSYQEVENDDDFWLKLSPSEKKAIDNGLADIEAGRVKSKSDVLKKYGL